MVAAVCILAVLPVAKAQPAGKVPRVGYLSPFSASDPEVQRGREIFRQALRELGYVEGQGITIEYRSAEGNYERLPHLAAELVHANVDVIVMIGGVPPAQAAQRATRVIPIVMSGVADPVAAGLVTSLARPGANITGPAMISDQLIGKEVELLREVVPNVTRVTVLWNPTNPENTHQLRGAERAAAALGMRLHAVEARSSGEVDRAFVAMTRQRAQALLVLLDAIFYDQRAPLYTGTEHLRKPEASWRMPRTVSSCKDKWPST